MPAIGQKIRPLMSEIVVDGIELGGRLQAAVIQPHQLDGAGGSRVWVETEEKGSVGSPTIRVHCFDIAKSVGKAAANVDLFQFSVSHKDEKAAVWRPNPNVASLTAGYWARRDRIKHAQPQGRVAMTVDNCKSELPSIGRGENGMKI